MKLSVIISAYNSQKTIGEALDSVFRQSFKDFELLVVDDGSNDRTKDCIKHINDRRLVFYSSNENKGLPVRLNELLVAAKGKYVARFDADDVCHPKRFERQLKYMDSHPDCGICGSATRTIGKHRKTTYPKTHREIYNNLFVNTPFAHPTVIMRRKILEDFDLKYNETLKVAQDYDLWVRLLEVTEGHNLSYPYVQYRQANGQLSIVKTTQQRINRDSIQKRQLARLIKATDEEVDLHIKVINNNWDPDPFFVQSALQWLTTLIEENRERRIFFIPEFSVMISQYAIFNLFYMLKKGHDLFYLYRASSLYKYQSLSLREKGKKFIIWNLHPHKKPPDNSLNK